nr:serine/threonine protein kinase [Propionibacterium sp.]
MPTEFRPPELPGFTLVGRLGGGGSGDVFAYDQRLPARRVAVKVLREPVTGAAQAAAFVAEADAMAALEHPHIVPVHAAGIAADGRPYLVMAFYPGPDLEVRCRTEPLPPAEALRVGVLVGGAVEVAHRRGILHRDIKPANILTSRFGVPGLADFGLAGSPGDGDGPDFGVSVPWAAPEVLFGTAPASVRSDVYALAATVWTLLVGRSPFESAEPGDTTVRLLRRIRTGAVPSVGRADVPPELDAVLAAGLAKDPAERPASALALVEGLRDVERRLGRGATDPLVGDLAPGPSSGGVPAAGAGGPRRTPVAAVLDAPPAEAAPPAASAA